MYKRHSLRNPLFTKLRVVIVIATLVQFSLSLGFGLTGYYVDLRKSYDEAVRSRLDRLASSIDRLTQLGLPLTEMNEIFNSFEEEKAYVAMSYVVVVDQRSQILMHTDPVLIGTKLPVDINELVKESETVTVPIGSTSTILVSRPISDSSKKVFAYLVGGYHASVLYGKVFDAFLRMLLAYGLTAAIGIYLIGRFYRRHISNPLRDLLDGIGRMSRSEYEEDIPVSDPESELGFIQMSVNTMRGEIRTSFYEKERLLAELRREEEKLREIIDKTEVGVAIVKKGKLAFVNAGFCRIFGIPSRNFDQTRTIFSYFPHRDEYHYRTVINEVLSTGRKQFFDMVRVIDEQGGEKVCMLEVSPFEQQSGEPDAITMTFQDVTDKARLMDELRHKNKLMEQLLTKYQKISLELQVANERLENTLIVGERANEELKRIDSLKDSFFSMVTHELKTPISLIQGYVGILKNDSAVKQSAIGTEIVSSVERAVRRLTGLTEEIIELMRIKSGKLSLALSPGFIGQLLVPVLAELKPMLEVKRITVAVTGMDTLPILQIDQKRIDVLLRNLLTNSIKFCKEDGLIEVAGGTTVEDGRKLVRISVRDEGCGIPPENLSRIFGEFYTAPPPDAVQGELAMRGSGLGLSIAKGVVEAHGGRIWVESPGYDVKTFPGTTFYFTIPVSEM